MLLCTVRTCHQPLVREERRVICARGHSFDIARSGYINLLQPQDRRSKEPGDTADAVMARRRLHDRGVTAPLRDAIASMANVTSEDVVLDAGCGDGFYLGSLDCDAHGVDISLPAIEAAAKRYPDCEWIVANADRFVPYADTTFTRVLTITARMNSSEFRRVVREDGRLLVAIPAPDDLVELRGAGRDRVQRTIETFANEFAIVEQRRATTTADLERDAVHDILLSIYRPRDIERVEPMRVTFSSTCSSSFHTDATIRRPMSEPYFSVVIPTYKRLPMLLRVLDALDAQDAAPEFEVIVIDDGSGDDTFNMMTARRAKNYPITFRSQTNSGPGRARNHGVSLASGRYILFIGDDTVPEPRFLAEHARVHRDANDDRLTACLGYTGWPPGERVTAFMDYINDYGLQFGYKLIRDGEIVPFNFFYTSNISIDRLLLSIDPFDTAFPAAAWEDTELAFRLDSFGLKIRYNAKAVTRHYHPMTIDSFARRQYTVGRSGAIFYRKHPELADFLGVHELETRTLADERRLAYLRRRARLGERFRVLATNKVFETLMREHYLRGLRDGLAAVS